MIILDKPFVSNEMKDYLNETQVLVLNNATVMNENCGYHFNLGESKDLLKRVTAGERIYTISENSLEWIYHNIADEKLIHCIDIMKNKFEFRKLLSDIYPNFYFREVNIQDLQNIDFDTLPVPLILKPTIGFFSVGVYTIQTKDDWIEALYSIEQQAVNWETEYPDSVVKTTSFILEQYIQGEEYALDAYYDKDGQVVILNIMKHDFISNSDVSDRLYYTSKELIENNLECFTIYLNQVNQVIGAKEFPFHVEIRVDHGHILPIEFNPMRFAGWCCTDLTYFAFGFRTYDYFLIDKKPDWETLLSEKEDKIFALIVLNKPDNYSNIPIHNFDYELLCKKFEKVLCLRKVDYQSFPIFGFLFTETKLANIQELDYIIKSNLKDFIHS